MDYIEGDCLGGVEVCCVHRCGVFDFCGEVPLVPVIAVIVVF